MEYGNVKMMMITRDLPTRYSYFGYSLLKFEVANLE